MGEKDVNISLYENGDWLNHQLSREIAKSIVRDTIKQMSDEPIHWLLSEMPRHQIEDLVEAAKGEMRERARSPHQPPEIRDGLRLLEDA